MKIKVYINKIKRDLTPLFTSTEQYFKDHGVNATFEYEKVDVKGLSANGSIMVGANALVDTTNADINVFLYDKDTFPNYLHSYTVMIDKPFCYVSVQGFEELGVSLPHEIMHALAYMFKAKDVMDTYYKNTVAQYKDADSNFEQQWKILKPYLTPTMPTATLTRSKSTTKETLGVLTATNGGATFICKTLELPCLNNQKMISCIPKGTYTVKKVFWAKKLKYFYQVQNVPGRSGIFIHEGNYFFNYEGCIGLGAGLADLNKDGQIDITSTVATVKAFDGFMGGKPFTLTVL